LEAEDLGRGLEHKTGVVPGTRCSYDAAAAAAHQSVRYSQGGREMSVRRVSYCYVTVPNRPGEGAKVLQELRQAKVKLMAYSGFPTRSGASQLDLIAKSLTPIRKVAGRNGWRLSAPKKGFLIQGNYKLGAVHRHVQRLADQKINVTAAEAVSAGKGRFGMLLWVKGKDYGRAAKALKAK
jgi:hypothetical protein